MRTAPAVLVVERIVAVEDRDTAAMAQLQLARPRLVGDAGVAVHVDAALEIAQHQRRPRRCIQLDVMEIAVPGMQQSFVTGANRDTAMAKRVARERNYQDVRFLVADQF